MTLKKESNGAEAKSDARIRSVKVIKAQKREIRCREEDAPLKVKPEKIFNKFSAWLLRVERFVYFGGEQQSENVSGRSYFSVM